MNKNENIANNLHKDFIAAYNEGQELGVFSPDTIAKLVIQRVNLQNMNMPNEINLEIKTYSKKLLDSCKDINILLLEPLQNKDNFFTENEKEKINSAYKKMNKTIHDVENESMSIGKLLMSKTKSKNTEDIAKIFKELIESRLKAKEENPLSSNRRLANEVGNFALILPTSVPNNIIKKLKECEREIAIIKGNTTNRIRNQI
jgi:hypothetical protein